MSSEKLARSEGDFSAGPNLPRSYRFGESSSYAHQKSGEKCSCGCGVRRRGGEGAIAISLARAVQVRASTESSNQCQETNSNGGIRVSAAPVGHTFPVERAHTIVRGVVVKFQFSHIAISTADGSGVSSQIRLLPHAHPVYDNAVRSQGGGSIPRSRSILRPGEGT